MLSNIIEEKYIISKHMHTAFTDLDEITPLEKNTLLRFIKRDAEAQAKAYEMAKVARKN